MITVEQFLQFNSRSIFSLKPENKVMDSLFLMAEKKYWLHPNYES